MPAKILGSALGNRSFSNIFTPEPLNERPRSGTSGSIERRPSTASITIAKIAIRKAMPIFEVSPVPSQITNSGASATFGTLFIATSAVNSVDSKNREYDDADRKEDFDHHR